MGEIVELRPNKNSERDKKANDSYLEYTKHALKAQTNYHPESALEAGRAWKKFLNIFLEV